MLKAMKNLIYLLTPFLALLISSCSQNAYLNAGIAARAEQQALCEKEPISRSTILARQDCKSKILNEHMIKAKYPHMPLLLQAQATSKQVAVAYAEGKISENEFSAYIQKIEADFAVLEEQQTQLKQQQQAQAWQAVSDNFQRQQALQNLNKPITTNCRSFGNNVNCTTW